MRTLDGKAGRFLELHHGDRPLLQPNAWDAGSAKVLATLGFEAIATTSSGHAATLGRLDGNVTRAEALDHCAALAGAVDIPVAADSENGYAHEPEGVAQSVRLLADTGIAGCSIEDYTGDSTDPTYDDGLARDRIVAAAEVAHAGPNHLVLTARCEHLLHGLDDLGAVIARLQSYQEAGADVLFAPGLRDLDAVRTVVAAVDLPVNVLATPGCESVDALAEAGVKRISVGGSFAWVALGAMAAAATELREQGTLGFWEQVGAARGPIRDALG